MCQQQCNDTHVYRTQSKSTTNVTTHISMQLNRKQIFLNSSRWWILQTTKNVKLIYSAEKKPIILKLILFSALPERASHKIEGWQQLKQRRILKMLMQNFNQKQFKTSKFTTTYAPYMNFHVALIFMTGENNIPRYPLQIHCVHKKRPPLNILQWQQQNCTKLRKNVHTKRHLFA